MSEVGSNVVMAVDDSKTMRDMVSFTLKDMGFEVMTAEDGVDALGVLSKTKVRLIVTDLNMPNMDGLALIENLKKAGANVKTPILMLTTEGDVEKIMKAKELGASGWIVKPFNPDKLKKAIQKVCG